MNSFKITTTLITISALSNFALLNAQEKQIESDKGTPKVIEVKVAPSDSKLDQQVHKPSGSIFFQNGDSITGQIINWDLNSMTIHSPDFLEPITFSNKYILTTLLNDKPKTNEKEFNNLTTLVLQHRNNQQGLHGVVKGSFSSISDTHVTLNTSYAGKINVLKKFVTKMEVDSKEGYLYTGPNSIEEWHDNNIYKVILNQNNRVSMQKYISGKQQRDNLKLEKTDQERERINLNRNNQNNLPNSLNARYDIYMSKSEGVFHIFRNGIKIYTIKDTAPKPGKFGSSIHLISSNSRPIRIKNFTLSRWNGHLPSEIDEEAFATLKGDGQRILLKNGDILLGKVGSVKDNIMEVDTLYTPIKLPIVRLRSVDLTSSASLHEPIMYLNDIKCWFNSQDWIILKPISLNGDKLTAYHQALGENQFDLNTFHRIDFNIYENNENIPLSSDDW